MFILFVYILPVLYLVYIRLCLIYKPYFLLKYKNYYNYYMISSSLINFTTMMIYIISTDKRSSFHSLLCDHIESDNILFNISVYIFFTGKYIEWIDTAYLILQNKKLSFLHVFHHASTGILTYLNTYPVINAFWCIPCITNTFVHFVMYSYYAGYFKQYKSYITKLQIIQHGFVLSCIIYVVIGYKYLNYAYCYNNIIPIYFGLFGYFMYFALFIKFYIQQFI